MIHVHETGQLAAPSLEWMRTPRERARGLLKYREAPRSNHAAIFELPLGGLLPIVHTFGMAFAIDIVYCDRDFKIVSLFKNVSPGRLIIPWQNLWGSAAFLIEFVDTRDLSLKVGQHLRIAAEGLSR